MASRIRITLDTSEVELAPGDRAEAKVTLTNTSGVVDSFVLTVDGLDPSWYAFASEQVGLFPGESTAAVLRLELPKDSTATAGTVPFSVIATSVDNPTEHASADLVLRLLLADEVSLEMDPQSAVGRKGLHNIIVANPSNRTLDLILRVTDLEEALRYILGTPYVCTDLSTNAGISEREEASLSTAISATKGAKSGILMGRTTAQGLGSVDYELEVPPGSSVVVPLQTAPNRQIWFGKERAFPFEVRVHPPGVEWAVSEAESVPGELVYRPILAFWSRLPLVVARALPIVLGLAFLALLLFLLPKQPDRSNPLNTSTQATQTTLAQGNGSATLTALAEGRNNAPTGAGSANGGSANGGSANGGSSPSGSNGSGSVSQARDGVPIINRFWLEIPPNGQPAAPPSGAQPNLQWDISSAQNVVVTPTNRSTLLPGWETSSIVDYNLTAIGAKGDATDTLSVILVRPPSIDLLSAEPMTITLGQISTLQWTIRGAKTATLDDATITLPSNGPGRAGGAGGSSSSGSGAGGSIGSLIVTPPETHIFILCAANAAGKNCQSVKVWVLLPGGAQATYTSVIAPPSSTATQSSTLLPATRIGTQTPKASTATVAHTATQISIGLPTASATGTPTRARTSTPITSPTHLPTSTSTTTATAAPTRTLTNTATSTPTYTPIKKPTNTPTNTPTRTPTNTPTKTPTRTPTNTPTRTPTNTPTSTPVCPQLTLSANADSNCTIFVTYSFSGGCAPYTVVLRVSTSCYPAMTQTIHNAPPQGQLTAPGCAGASSFTFSGTITVRDAQGNSASKNFSGNGTCNLDSTDYIPLECRLDSQGIGLQGVPSYSP